MEGRRMSATVLVVEDHPTNMKLVTMLLSSAGHTVLQASTALQGIALAKANLPDLILMDIQLPDMDGLTAIHQLKSEATTMHIPIVALTAFAMKGDQEKAFAAGCDGYITKPIRYRDFLNQIEKLIAKHNGQPHGH